MKGRRFDNPTAIVVDETWVYAESAGQVLRVSKEGSADPTPLLPRTIASGLALDADYLYVSAALSDLCGPGLGGILRVDKRTLETTVLTRHHMPSAVAVDDATVWYGALDDRVWRIPKRGGKPVGVPGIYGTTYAIDLDASRAYFAVSTYGGKQKGRIYSAPRKGGPATVVVDGLLDAMSVAVLGEDVYFNDNGTILVRPLAGGEAKRISTSGSATGLVRIARGVCWSAVDLRQSTSYVGCFQEGSQYARTLATGPGPVGVAADATSVYWADATARELVSVSLP